MTIVADQSTKSIAINDQFIIGTIPNEWRSEIGIPKKVIIGEPKELLK